MSESGAVAWSARAGEGLPGPPFYRRQIPPEAVRGFLAELRESGFTGSAHNRYRHCIPCAQVVTVIVDDGTSVIAVSTSKSLTVFGQPAVGGTSATLTAVHPAKAPDDPDAYVEALITRFLPLAEGGAGPLDDLRFERRQFEYVIPFSR